MKEDIAIKVDGVSKTFKLPHERHGSIKNALFSFFKGGKRSYEKQEVLKNINFEIKKGEFFGIVGRNGSGKSTLLKLIAGVYSPNKGAITVNGKLTPFIELGVGFNMDLTGRENVFLNGSLLGFNRAQMEEMYDEIVEFAELERFMDQKLKNYSSGMQVRLAFSVAIRAKSDILVLDEVLAVGDEDFQRKCNNYFEEIKGQGKTVILVTHNMDAVKRYCSKAMLVGREGVISIGDPFDVANQYSMINMNSSNLKRSKNKEKIKDSQVKKLDLELISPSLLSSKDNLEFEVIYELNQEVKVDLGFSIIYRGQSVVEHNTQKLNLGSKKDTEYRVRYKMPLKYFHPAEMDIYISIFKRDGFVSIGSKAKAASFAIKYEGGPKGGLLSKRGKWILPIEKGK